MKLKKILLIDYKNNLKKKKYNKYKMPSNILYTIKIFCDEKQTQLLFSKTFKRGEDALTAGFCWPKNWLRILFSKNKYNKWSVKCLTKYKNVEVSIRTISRDGTQTIKYFNSKEQQRLEEEQKGESEEEEEDSGVGSAFTSEEEEEEKKEEKKEEEEEEEDNFTCGCCGQIFDKEGYPIDNGLGCAKCVVEEEDSDSSCDDNTILID